MVPAMRKNLRRWGGAAFGLVIIGMSAPVFGQSSLGTAQAFAVLGGSTVTNTGASVITGDLGVSPGSAVTGFPPGIVTGTIHAANATALQAQNDVTTAYKLLASAACLANLTGRTSADSRSRRASTVSTRRLSWTGTLTLDAQGSAGATFIFKTGSTLTTASASSVLLINGGNPCGVAWQIGSWPMPGTTTSFIGNLIALTSITLNTDANIIGRALARNGAVTLDSNNISFAACGSTVPPVPTLSQWMMIGLAGLLCLTGAVALRQRQRPI